MRFSSRPIFLAALWTGITVLTIMIGSSVRADTIELKKGDKLKGLVVEEHEDRIILSTADGEKQVLRRDILKIDYDDPAYSLLNMGRELERANKLGEALSYYEKASELNAQLDEARTAALGVRGKLWAGFTEGPVNEIQKQQEIQDAWRADTTMEAQSDRIAEENESLLWTRMAVRLIQDQDFIRVGEVRIGGYAHQSGLRAEDLIYALDGHSMRYIQKRVAIDELLNPRYASASLEIRRKIMIPAELPKSDLRSLGISLRQEYSGATIGRIKSGSEAERLGFKPGDRVVRVGGSNTRYMPLSRIGKTFKSNQGKAFAVETGRTLQMARQ